MSYHRLTTREIQTIVEDLGNSPEANKVVTAFNAKYLRVYRKYKVLQYILIVMTVLSLIYTTFLFKSYGILATTLSATILVGYLLFSIHLIKKTMVDTTERKIFDVLPIADKVEVDGLSREISSKIAERLPKSFTLTSTNINYKDKQIYYIWTRNIPNEVPESITSVVDFHYRKIEIIRMPTYSTESI